MSKSAWWSSEMARERDERPCEFDREERALVKLSDGEREKRDCVVWMREKADI